METRCILALLILVPEALVASTSAQEAPTPERSNYGHLKVLEPFLGRWVYEGTAKRTVPGILKEGAQVRAEMAYRWAVDKNALVLAISISPKGAKEYTILEMIGWDAKRQMIVSGSFNSAGGMSYGQWRVDENRLIIRTRDVSCDGKDSSSTIIHELHGDDVMSWSETDRVVDGEKRPDSPTYEFKRTEKMKGTGS